jgi:hypothetical protein
MFRTRWFKATAVVAIVTATVLTGGTAWSADGRTRSRYSQAQLQSSRRRSMLTGRCAARYGLAT